MKDNTVICAIKNRLKEFSNSTADAIMNSEWKILLRNIFIALVSIFCTSFLFLIILTVAFKILQTLFGKVLMSILGFPLIVTALFLSYKENVRDSRTVKKENEAGASLETWAEDMYDILRDAMFLVLRTMADYTAIIKPTSPGGVELPNGISIRDGYAVFTFFARVTETIDVSQLKREVTRTLGQMSRAHELRGIPSDLVEISGSFYTPLQVFDLVDYGDSVNISIVFATEKTVELVHARKLLHLENPRLGRQMKQDAPYDDEL